MRNLNINGLREAISSRIVSFANRILGNGNNNFLKIQGTLPSSTSANVFGVNYTITSAGSAANAQIGMILNLNSGYTGASSTYGLIVNNLANSTAVDTLGAATGNNTVVAQCSNSCTGTNTGIQGYADNAGGGKMVGVLASCRDADSAFGKTGLARSLYAILNGNCAAGSAAGYFTFGGGGTTIPASPTTSLIQTSNLTGTQDHYIAYHTATPTEVFAIASIGDFRLNRTITAAGTTGNRTIDKPAGTVNIAAAGTTVTVTNNLCTASSLVFCALRTNDATASIKSVVPAAGSFVINIVACTAEVSIGFWLTN